MPPVSMPSLRPGGGPPILKPLQETAPDKTQDQWFTGLVFLVFVALALLFIFQALQPVTPFSALSEVEGRLLGFDESTVETPDGDFVRLTMLLEGSQVEFFVQDKQKEPVQTLFLSLRKRQLMQFWIVSATKEKPGPKMVWQIESDNQKLLDYEKLRGKAVWNKSASGLLAALMLVVAWQVGQGMPGFRKWSQGLLKGRKAAVAETGA